MTPLAPMLKNSICIIVLLLLGANNVMAQTDSLKVYLEKNKEHKYGIDLVFENNYRDTIMLITKFENLSFGGEMPQHSGINMLFYDDGQLFGFNWGEGAVKRFDFFDGFALIAPHSKLRLSFNLRSYYFFPEDTSNKYEVDFVMNYLYGKYRSSSMPKYVTYFRTNRITIFEPPKEEPENDNPCPDAEK